MAYIQSYMSSHLGLKEVPGWQEQWEIHERLPENLHERDKRYGRVFEVFDETSLYVVRLQLPQSPPHHRWLYQFGLPQTLSPYLVEASVIEKTLIISGKIQDPLLEKLCGLINSFPDRFEIKLPIDFTAKNLEVLELGDYIRDIKITKI